MNAVALIGDLILLGCGHCKKMKPEYDEAAEILNKGVDVSFMTVFWFVLFCLFVSDTGSHAGYGSPSLAAANNHNNPFSCPECCWRMWLPCCVHQPAFSLVLISGFPLCYYVFCGEQTPPPPQFRGRPP